MIKPSTFDGYSDRYTLDWDRVLETLLRGLGPWKESVYLVGGLTLRYLVSARPPTVPAHAGTRDVDIVIGWSPPIEARKSRGAGWARDSG